MLFCKFLCHPQLHEMTNFEYSRDREWLGNTFFYYNNEHEEQ